MNRKRPRARRKPDVNRLLSEFLMCSYLYYNNYPKLPLSDDKFNSICKVLLKNWDAVTHPHKHLCDKEMLRAETGYSIDFPLMVQGAAISWIEEIVRNEDETIS